MARPAKITHTGNGSTVSSSVPYPLNWRQSEFNVGLAFQTTGGTTQFTVEWTLDNLERVDEANLTWFGDETLKDLTAGASGRGQLPATALRLTASAAGTNTGTLWIVQAGG